MCNNCAMPVRKSFLKLWHWSAWPANLFMYEDFRRLFRSGSPIPVKYRLFLYLSLLFSLLSSLFFSFVFFFFISQDDTKTNLFISYCNCKKFELLLSESFVF